jgi:hypothetical protein
MTAMCRFISVLILIGMLGCPTSVSAAVQQVYKCQQSDGQIVYQSAICQGTSLAHWEVRPDPADPRLQERLQAIDQELRQRNRPRQSRLPRAASNGRRRTKTHAETCEQMRAAREKAFAKAWMKRDFAMTRHWDERVHRACNFF